MTGIGLGIIMLVKGLKEGKKYKFRVKVENIYGVGEFLEIFKFILVKNLFGKLFLFYYFIEYID